MSFPSLKIFSGGWSQDGRVGGCGVQVSPQLGHLPDAGGGPRHPRGWEEPPSDQVGCQGTEGAEKWRPDGTGTPEGWLGEGRGSHAWRDPRGFGGSAGGMRLGFPLPRSEEHTSELQSHHDLVCRLLL